MNFVFLFFLLFFIFIALSCVNNYKSVYENFQQDTTTNTTTSNSFFRIVKRKENKTLQYQSNKLMFDTKNNDFHDLWTFWDKQLYNLNYGIYLTFNKDTKMLGFSNDKPKNSSWIMNDKGRLIYIDNTTKKEYCVPIDTLDEKVMDKKCVDYGYYFEIINEPFKLKQGEIMLIQERLEFPEKTTKNWKKNPSSNKKFGNTNIKIYGDLKTFKLKETKNDANEINFTIDILKPTVLWIFVTTTLNESKINQKITKDKKSENKNVNKKINKKVCDDISQTKSNFGIEYHKMYPQMVEKLTSKTAIEFGVQDPDSQKIYRCRDILTSPYYIKKFKCLF